MGNNASQCLNGHPANSEGNCSDPNCNYRITEKHKDGRFNPADRERETD